MENPNDKQKKMLIQRIVGSVDRLNDALKNLNAEMESIEKYHADIAFVSDIWCSYDRKMNIYQEANRNRNLKLP